MISYKTFSYLIDKYWELKVISKPIRTRKVVVKVTQMPSWRNRDIASAEREERVSQKNCFTVTSFFFPSLTFLFNLFFLHTHITHTHTIMRLVVRQDYEEVSAWTGIIKNIILYNIHNFFFFFHIKFWPHARFYIKAHYIKERINQFQPSKERPFVLGLPTGSSPVGTYHRLSEFCKSGELSFKHVVTFNMDEYVGIPR